MKTKKPFKSKTILLAVILIFTTVLLPMLQSCDENDSIINSNTESNNDSLNFDSETSNIENNTPKNESESKLTSVKMQESSNKLVIYIHPFIEDILTPSLNIFKEKYPDVEIDLREWGAGALQIVEGVGAFADATLLKEYYQVLRTELMAGKGPDLIVGYPSDIDNIYKMMDSGVFADLNPFIENDGEFNIDDYNKVVLDAGIYKGKRYIMPLDYQVPVILTTQEILDAEGIKLSDLSAFDGFFNTINKYNEKYKDNAKKSVFKKSINSGDIINYAFPWCGIDIVDWKNGKTKIDAPRFKTVMDAMKWAYVLEKDEVHESVSGLDITTEALLNQNWLFGFPELYNPGAVFGISGRLRDNKLTPVVFPYPDINNKTSAKVETIAVIPKASQNQVNAYNLLKIILSEDIQSNGFGFTYTPVLKKSAKAIFGKMYKDFYSYDTEILKEEDKYINMLTNIDSCKLMDPVSYYDYFLKDMRPYYEGKQSFEQFLKILKNDLELYISE